MRIELTVGDIPVNVYDIESDSDNQPLNISNIKSYVSELRSCFNEMQSYIINIKLTVDDIRVNVCDIESNMDNQPLKMDGLKPLAGKIQFNISEIKPAMGYSRLIFTNIQLFFLIFKR